jgi:heme exporter protein A
MVPAMTRAGSEGFEPATFSGAGLACRRGGHDVFARLDFSLGRGEALVLRGPNGSGKTTLLRLMAGLAAATAGRLAWNGTPVADDPEAHGARTRLVGHLDGIKAALTVAENLTFWANLHGGTSEAAVAGALGAFGLGRMGHLPARVLSAGQRHRLALARLLVKPAPLWLLDEPTNALDDDAVAALARALSDHQGKGGMVVLTTHGAAPIGEVKTLNLGAFTATGSHWSDAA